MVYLYVFPHSRIWPIKFISCKNDWVFFYIFSFVILQKKKIRSIFYSSIFFENISFVNWFQIHFPEKKKIVREFPNTLLLLLILLLFYYHLFHLVITIEFYFIVYLNLFGTKSLIDCCCCYCRGAKEC